MQHERADRRRALGLVGIASVLTGAILVAGGFTNPAGAADAPAYFPVPGYDIYLKSAHRGALAADFVKAETSCPDLTAVSGETAWHFVLDGSDHDFTSVSVKFGDQVLTGLTPKAANDPTFDITKNYVSEPTGKHAYVFSAQSGVVLVDAAANLSPHEVVEADFQLSHTCVGTGVTTTTTTSTSTTTSTTSTTLQQTGATVQGVVVQRPADPQVQGAQTLPATGDEDLTMAMLGMGLILLGSGAILMGRGRATA